MKKNKKKSSHKRLTKCDCWYGVTFKFNKKLEILLPTIGIKKDTIFLSFSFCPKCGKRITKSEKEMENEDE